MGSTLRAVENAVTAFVVAGKRACNSLIKINQIPPEVFLNIICLSLDRKERHLKRVQEIIAVSWGWKTTIEAAPFLWAVVNSWDHPVLAAKTQGLSGNHPLEITASTTPPPDLWGNRNWGNFSDTLSSAFLTTLFPHAERWKIATLQINNRAMIHAMKTVSVPLLERLTLQVEQTNAELGSDDSDAIDLFYGKASRLRALDLSNITVPWTSELCHNLEELCLSYVQLPLDWLLEVLTHSPNLSMFRLTNVSVAPSNPPEYLRNIQLPALQSVIMTTNTFYIEVHPELTPLHLIPYLIVPAESSLSIEFCSQSPPNVLSNSARESLVFVASRIQSDSLSSGELKNAIDEKRFYCNSVLLPATQKHSVDLAVLIGCLDFAMEMLLPTLPNVQVDSLRLGPNLDLRETHIPSLLRIPNVKMLRTHSWVETNSLEGEDDSGGRLTRKVDVDGLVFPGLERIIIRGECRSEGILKIVQASSGLQTPLKRTDVWTITADWPTEHERAVLRRISGDIQVEFHHGLAWHDVSDAVATFHA